jgi:hypothetical protein
MAQASTSRTASAWAFVELCLQVPASLKLRGLTEKYLLRRAVRHVLPPEVVRRQPER